MTDRQKQWMIRILLGGLIGIAVLIPLGGIFNDFQSIPFSNIQNCVHLTGHACVMYRNYSPCLVCNGVLDQTFIYIHGFRMHIYKHNPCPSKDKCIGSRDKCIGWHNHLVSGLNICQI